MNLLRIISSMDPASGGPCQGIRNSIPELEKIGVHNEVVSLDDPAAKFLGKDSFLIHAIGPTKGVWGYGEKLMPWLAQNLGRFDAVIVHGLWLYHSYAAAKAIRRLNDKSSASPRDTGIPKLYVMPHGMLDPYFQRAPERRLKAIRNWIFWKLIEAKVINESAGVLFTCEAELLLARQTFRPYSPKREINVGYGIPLPPVLTSEMRESFLRKCPQLRDQPYFLFLSRIHEKKGVDLLIDAYTNAIEKLHQNPGTRLVIAGPGLETPFGQRIFQMVQRTESVKDLVYFPGMLTGDAKWGAFYGCESFILPSHQENFGIAVAEALACGKPVLISNQVNIWREIQDGGGGLVADDSAEGMKNLLAEWVNLSGKEREEMGDRAKLVFEKYFSIGPAARRLADGITAN